MSFFGDIGRIVGGLVGTVVGSPSLGASIGGSLAGGLDPGGGGTAVGPSTVNKIAAGDFSRIPSDLLAVLPESEKLLFLAGRRAPGELAALFGDRLKPTPTPTPPEVQVTNVAFSSNGFGAQPVMALAPLIAPAGTAIVAAGARALTGLSLARKMIFERTGTLFSGNALKSILRQFGAAFVITAGLMTAQEALLVATSPARRRGRGITAVDLRRTRSTLRKVGNIRRDLQELCGTAVGSRRGTRRRTGHPTIIAQN